MSMNYIKPRVSYPNAEKYKSIIYKENRGKSGFYCWTNLITGKFYIGSSENLFLRFKKYYSAYNIKTELKRSKSIIFSSLLKNGYANFKLEILEYITFPDNFSKEENNIILVLLYEVRLACFSEGSSSRSKEENTIMYVY